MKYYIIAGEASGDLHGSNLMKSLKKADHEADFRFWGGDLMHAVAPGMVKHYKDTAFMGIVPVIMHLRTILSNIRLCVSDIGNWKPDVVILIDYPGFNLRIAKEMHNRGFRIYYYISPKIWAWKSSRVKIIKQYVDRMFVIFPFETAFYQKFGYEVEYVGNPLMDQIETFLSQAPDPDFMVKNNLSQKPIIALLPGSRRQEIKNILPVMLTLVDKIENHQFVIAGAPDFGMDFYRPFTRDLDVKVIFGQTYPLLKHAKAAVVTSGTATLETALLDVPQVVCYKFMGGALTYNLGKALFLKVPFISLVNLIMGQKVVDELIQQHLTADNLYNSLTPLLDDSPLRRQVMADLKLLREKVGKSGASDRAAQSIIKSLK